MPTQTTRAPRVRRAPTRPARRSAAQRRGIAGGWIQRRPPQPTGARKALAAVKGAVPASKGASAAAAGLALLGAAGLAYRRRDKPEPAAPAEPAIDTAPFPRPAA
jgi:hypothetical protein